MEFRYVIILICIVFTIFLVFKEIRRADKSRLVLRLLASIFMIASFAFLIIPITYSVTKEEPAHEINILTEGFKLDSISTINGNKYDLDSTLFPKTKRLKINHIADLVYFLKEHPEIKKINIYGYGLDDSQLKGLSDHQISFHASALPSGIVSANWTKRLNASENLKIQGIYNNQTNKNIKLKLFGLGASLDSTEIKAHSKVNFSFLNRPKQQGKAIYKLFALQGNDTLSAEPVPFEVEKKAPIQVLILASFPDFEYKFLKKWLYENQYPVAFRSQISKNKYSTDFLNMKAVNLNQINRSLLKNMDLVVIDEDELSSISGADKSSIYNAVNDGMGLIVRVTNSKPNGNSQNFNQYEVLSSTEKPLSLKSIDNLKFNNLPFTQSLYLKAGANNQPLILDETGKIVVNSQISGMGKIVTSSLSSTYQWQLAGKQSDYGRFWLMLFAKSLRKKVKNQSLEISPKFPSVNEKLRFIVNSADSKLPKILIDGTKIYPRQNMELPFEWDGFFWPKTPGWVIATINQKAERIYIYKKEDWLNFKSTLRQTKNLDFFKNQQKKIIKPGKMQYSTEDEISKWWFLLTFLITSAFLWYESRVLANK
ncbi:hypothetical protein [Pedobacter paludis]|uniref:Aerotolerance regulator N-terminal domain-containing protein n=1 Tax=Pedobacter paludis TaxID=2203212 RepID=A0A317EY79_9SPHI|nr:hypothetical protein [Pedobacter paludis]PWS30208.1 hypothetical protein DF947_19815 [Pedobacter paludis]